MLLSIIYQEKQYSIINYCMFIRTDFL